jgi:hypothetical protein
LPNEVEEKKIGALKCTEVHWFYMKPGEKEWTPFSGKTVTFIFTNISV